MGLGVSGFFDSFAFAFAFALGIMSIALIAVSIDDCTEDTVAEDSQTGSSQV